MTTEEKLEKLTAWVEKMSAYAETPDQEYWTWARHQEYWTWGNHDDTFEYGHSIGYDEAVKDIKKILEG